MEWNLGSQLTFKLSSNIRPYMNIIFPGYFRHIEWQYESFLPEHGTRSVEEEEEYIYFDKISRRQTKRHSSVELSLPPVYKYKLIINQSDVIR